jgi:hypothetical protein
MPAGPCSCAARQWAPVAQLLTCQTGNAMMNGTLHCNSGEDTNWPCSARSACNNRTLTTELMWQDRGGGSKLKASASTARLGDVQMQQSQQSTGDDRRVNIGSSPSLPPAASCCCSTRSWLSSLRACCTERTSALIVSGKWSVTVQRKKKHRKLCKNIIW